MPLSPGARSEVTSLSCLRIAKTPLPIMGVAEIVRVTGTPTDPAEAVRVTSVLLLPSHPATVAGFIIPIPVNPPKRGSYWPLAHISQEVLKSAPAFAHADAPTAVSMPGRMLGIATANAHASPRTVSGRWLATAPMPMPDAGIIIS